jgi:hypothetical protein
MSAEELRGELLALQTEVDGSVELFGSHAASATENAETSEGRTTGSEGVEEIIGQTERSITAAEAIATALTGDSRDNTEEMGRLNQNGSKVGELATWMANIAERSNNDNATQALAHLEDASGASERAQEGLAAANTAIEEAAEAAAGATEDLKSALGKLATAKDRLNDAVANFTASGEQDAETKGKLEAASAEIEAYIGVI